MKKIIKDKLDTAFKICEEEDRSAEYIIQFLQDYANVDFDCVMNYIEATWEKGKV